MSTLDVDKSTSITLTTLSNIISEENNNSVDFVLKDFSNTFTNSNTKMKNTRGKCPRFMHIFGSGRILSGCTAILNAKKM